VRTETVPSRANSPMLNMTRACTLSLRESQARKNPLPAQLAIPAAVS
jgi:hypothetical protein